MKKLRMILPVATVLLAAAGAWATTAFKKPYLNGAVPVSIMDAKPCNAIHSCAPAQNKMCKLGDDFLSEVTVGPETCSVFYEGDFLE